MRIDGHHTDRRHEKKRMQRERERERRGDFWKRRLGRFETAYGKGNILSLSKQTGELHSVAQYRLAVTQMNPVKQVLLAVTLLALTSHGFTEQECPGRISMYIEYS